MTKLGKKIIKYGVGATKLSFSINFNKRVCVFLAFLVFSHGKTDSMQFHIISRSGNTNRLRSSKSLPTKSASVYSLQVNSLIIYFWFHFYPLLALIELYEDLIIVLFCVVLWSSFLEGIFFLQLELLQKVADSVSSNFKVTILT